MEEALNFRAENFDSHKKDNTFNQEYLKKNNKPLLIKAFDSNMVWFLKKKNCY